MPKRKILLIIILSVFMVLPSFTTAAADIQEISFLTNNPLYSPEENSFLEHSVKEIEENYDLKFKYKFIREHYPSADTVEVITNRIKDGEAATEIYGLAPMEIELIADELLYPLDDIIEPDYFESLPPTIKPIKKAAVYKPSNQLYALPSLSRDLAELKIIIEDEYGVITSKRVRENMSRNFPFYQGLVVFWNQELFKKEDLPDPYQLMRDNQWSWERMIVIADKATRDLNHDGTIDQWGLGGLHSDNVSRIFPELLMSFGAELIDYESPEIVANVTGKEILALLDYLHTLNEEEIISQDPMAVNKFIDGEIAMLVTELSSLHRIKIMNNDLDFGFIYMPSYHPNENHVIPVPSSLTLTAALPVSVDNPELIVEIYNDIYQPYFEHTHKEIRAMPDVMEFTSEEKELYLEMSENWEPVDPLSGRMIAPAQTNFGTVLSGIINGEYERDKIDVLNELLPELNDWISDILE